MTASRWVVVAAIVAFGLCVEGWRYLACVSYTHHRGVCLALVVGQ